MNLASSWMIPNKLKKQNKNLINILTETKIQKAHKLKIKLKDDLIPSGIALMALILSSAVKPQQQ